MARTCGANGGGAFTGWFRWSRLKRAAYSSRTKGTCVHKMRLTRLEKIPLQRKGLIKLIFIELPLFTSLVTQITDDHYLNQLQNDLLKNPEKGDIVPHLQGRSRAGGARVIYHNLPQHHAVIFFYIYTKAKSENLTPGQEKRLRAAVETIKREFRHENQGH